MSVAHASEGYDEYEDIHGVWPRMATDEELGAFIVGISHTADMTLEKAIALIRDTMALTTSACTVEVPINQYA